MNDPVLLVQVLLGGALVIASYAWALHQPRPERLWGGVTWSSVRTLWAVSGGLTALSFLHITGSVIFRGDIQVPSPQINLACGAIIWPAALWAYITFGVLKDEISPFFLFIDLLAVALGSMGVLFVVAPLNDEWLNLSAAIIVFQHLFMDQIIWLILFMQKYQDVVDPDENNMI